MVVIDFEASGLHENSFPIEVAWVGDQTKLSNYVIAPLDRWNEPKLWCEKAEAIHQFSYESLSETGIAAEAVANYLLNALTNESIYSDNPSFDQRWLNELMSKTGVKHNIQLQDLHELLDSMVDSDTKQAVFHYVRQYSPPTHRAGRDVEFLYEAYNVCLKYQNKS